MAQKIARDRGSVFDIEAFMPHSLREEWEAVKRGEEWPRPTKVVDENDKEDKDHGAADKGPAVQGSDTGVDNANGLANGDGTGNGNGSVTRDGLPDLGNVTTTAQGDDSVPSGPADPVLDSTASDTDIKPATTETPAVPVKQPFKLTPNHPALMNMHWKQRQKRLTQLAAREAAIEKGQIPEFFPELEALIRLEEEKEREKEKEVEAGQKRKRGMTAADIEGIRASASHWYACILRSGH